MNTNLWMYCLVPLENKCACNFGLADGRVVGSWYSVLRHLSSNFCSTLCAFEADLMSINDTVAHKPLAPNATSSFDLANILTLCTRPYLMQTQKTSGYNSVIEKSTMHTVAVTERWRVNAQ